MQFTTHLLRRALVRILQYLLLTGSVPAGAALAQPLETQLLPPLHGALQVQTDVRPSPRLTWQVFQQLSYQPGSWHGRLELQPSLSLMLHDPQEGIRQQVDATASQLQALENALRSGREALSVHRDHLLLQHYLFLEGLYLDWLGHWERLPDPAGQPLWRSDLARREAELLLQESRNELQLLSRRLQSAGIDFTEPPRQLSRPLVSLGNEPYATCLAGSPESRRLELLNTYQEMESELAAAGRRLSVELTAGLNLSLTGAGQGAATPGFGWNAGLSIARADHGGARLQVDVSPASVSQSLTFRGPASLAAEYEAADTGLASALEAEAQRIHSLLLARNLAADREELQRSAAEAGLAELWQAVEDGSADRSQLQPTLQSMISLLHAALQHDTLLLELASLCRLPVSYVEVPEYP